MTRSGRTPTVLVRRRGLVLAAGTVTAALLFNFYVGTIVHPVVEGAVAGFIEIAAGISLVLATGLVAVTGAAIRRSRQLESELRRSRSTPQEDPEARGVVRTNLGDAIRSYNRDLHRSAAVRSARIQAQRELIRSILGGVDRPVYVFSGSGDLLYRSAGTTGDEDTDDEVQPRLEPTGAVIAAHLLAGNGPGDVTVDGAEMHFMGVFGKTIAEPKSDRFGDAELLPGLAYIIVSERVIAPGQLTKAPVPWGGRPTLATRLRTIFTGRR